MKAKQGLFFIFLCMFCVYTGWADNAPKIMFLRYHLDHGVVSLVKSDIREGSPKPFCGTPEDRDYIFYDVFSEKGELIWTGRLLDPTVRRQEVAHRDDTRLRAAPNLILPITDFVIRVPCITNASYIEFFRVGSVDRDASGWLPSFYPGLEQNAKKLLAHMELPRGE